MKVSPLDRGILKAGLAEVEPAKKMPAGNSPPAWVMGSLTPSPKGAQKRVTGQLVPLFKPAHEQDPSAKPFVNSKSMMI